MNQFIVKRVGILCAAIGITAITLSATAAIAYIYTLLGFAVWALIGHIVTADDDLPGGWSNPEGKEPFPWRELVVKISVVVALALVAYYFPSARSFGAR